MVFLSRLSDKWTMLPSVSIMKLGIIGLPKSGKTTVFEMLTRSFPESRSKSENRIGTVSVPDKRVGILSGMYRPKKTIFTRVEYFLPGKLEKRGDQVWNRVHDCNALIHVVRNFETFGGDHPTTQDDFRRLDQELILADQIIVEKRLENLNVEKKRGRKIDNEELSALEQCLANLEAETPLRKIPELASAHILKGFAFLSAKPTLVLYNNSDDDRNTPSDTIAENERCMVVRAKLEHEIAQMTDEEADDFLKEYNINTMATDRIIKTSYDLLGLISFFTVGEDEVKAWTIAKETVAADAAKAIHSDIKKGFIRAEVLHYDKFIEAGNYQEAKKRGTVRLESKTYPVKDGDIINFRFNV